MNLFNETYYSYEKETTYLSVVTKYWIITCKKNLNNLCDLGILPNLETVFNPYSNFYFKIIPYTQAVWDSGIGRDTPVTVPKECN